MRIILDGHKGSDYEYMTRIAQHYAKNHADKEIGVRHCVIYHGKGIHGGNETWYAYRTKQAIIVKQTNKP